MIISDHNVTVKWRTAPLVCPPLCSSGLVHGVCEWSASCLWSLYPWSEGPCWVAPRRFGMQRLGSQPWPGLGPAFPTRGVVVAIWDSSNYFWLFVILLITVCTSSYWLVCCRRHFHTHARTVHFCCSEWVNPGRGGRFFLQNVKTPFGAHPTCYSVCTGVLSRW